MTAYETDAAIHDAGFITVLDAAAELNVTRLTVDKMIASGRLHAVRRGRRWVTTTAWVAQAHRGHRPRRHVPAGMLTVNEAAERAGVHPVTVRKAIKDGRLAATTPTWPDGYGISPDDLDAWAPHARRPRHNLASHHAAAAAWRRENSFLSVAEAAELVGITPEALRVRITRGRQEAVRAGADAPVPGAWLIHQQDVVQRRSA